MEIEKNHEIVGRKNSDLGTFNLGSCYPVLGPDSETVIGIFSSEFGTPDGYKLDYRKQAYVEVVERKNNGD